MEDLAVRMREPIRESATFWGYGQYYFDSTRPKWTWPLQKIGIWILVLFGSEYRHQVETVAMHSFQAKDVMDEVLHAKRAIELAYCQTHRLVVYMGEDKYRKLVSSDTVRMAECGGAVRVPMNPDLHLTGERGAWTIYGMELILVPWMEGMLVVPDIDDLRRPGS